MSEDLDNEIVDEIEEVEEQDESPKFSREDWENKQKEIASSSGWKDFEDYVADGGDPAKWKTADAYNIYGELVSSIKNQKRDFENRIEGYRKLSTAQIAAERARLSAEKDQAIEDGNKQAVHAIDKQLNSLNVTQDAPVHTSLDEWNNSNPWIFEDTPKADRAKAVFTRATANGTSISDAIALVESVVAKEFAAKPKPQGRVTIPESERGKGSAGFGKKSGGIPTMDSLTPEELIPWKHMREAWKDEKEFLQAVADDRKAAKGTK